MCDTCADLKGWGSYGYSLATSQLCLDMDYGERAVCVIVNGSRKIVNGLDWRTTAQDIIQSLRPRSGPQVLLESWRGCVRPVKEDEHICRILEEWGEESSHVQLVLMNARDYAGYRRRPGLRKADIYRAQSHGKVASNKKKCLSRFSTPKTKMTAQIERLIETMQANRERLAALQAPLAAESTPEVWLYIKIVMWHVGATPCNIRDSSVSQGI